MNIQDLGTYNKKRTWLINGVKVVLSKTTASHSEIIENIVEELMKRLLSYEPLIQEDELNAIYSVTNVLRVVAFVFPDLTRKYIKHHININSEKVKENLTITQIWRSMIAHKKALIGDYTGAVPEFEEIFKSEINNYIIALLHGESALFNNVRFKLAYIGRKQFKSNFHTWIINDIKLDLNKIDEYFLPSLNAILLSLEKRLINLEKLYIITELNSVFNLTNILNICVNLFPNQTKKYIKSVIEKLERENIPISASTICNTLGENCLANTCDVASPQFMDMVYMEVNNHIGEKLSNNTNNVNYGMNFLSVKCIGKKGVGQYYWEIGENTIILPVGEKFEDIVLEIGKMIEHNMKNEMVLLQEEHLKHLHIQVKFIVPLTIAVEIYPKLFEDYINRISNQCTLEREVISLEYVYKKMIPSVRRISMNFKDYKFDNIIRATVRNKWQEQYATYPLTNLTEGIKFQDWKLYKYVDGKDMKRFTIKISSINKLSLRNEVKYYLLEEIKNPSNFRRIQDELPRLSRALNFISENYQYVNYCADINISMVKSLVNHLKIEARKANGEKLKVGTQADIIQCCKKLVEFLRKSDNIKTKKPINNPFDFVGYHNLESMEKNTDIIPEEVVEKLLAYIDELNPIHQRILLIALNTGLRFKEIMYLEENCLRYDKALKTWVLEYIPWKVLEARRKSNLSDYNDIAIKEFIAYEIEEQKNNTLELRNKTKSNRIFLTSTPNTIYDNTSLKGAVSFNTAINRLIKRHAIKHGNELWHFTSKQCRKTLAVELISNGAHPREVTYQLGHLQEYTTNKYYNEVKKMKLAEMNSNFFKQKFGFLITEEQLAGYSEEERKQLYIGFCTDYREVELGKCIKHFGEGECSRLNTDEISCATCDKLCVSISSLPKWIKMKDSKLNLIESLKILYKKEGINETEYETYREYQRELFLFKAYQDVINKLLELKEANNGI